MAAYVYILASQRNGTIYVGATTDLIGRVYQHKIDAVEGFTKKYAVHRLVYFETYDDLEAAFTRERQIKKWNRAWQMRLIEEKNPSWEDLYLRLPVYRRDWIPAFVGISESLIAGESQSQSPRKRGSRIADYGR